MNKAHEFANKVVEELKATYGLDCVVKEVNKNGVMRVGIQPDVELLPAGNVVPCMYVESLNYEDVAGSAEIVYKCLNNNPPFSGRGFLELVHNRDYVFSHLFCAVENSTVSNEDDYFVKPVRDWDLNMNMRISVDLGGDRKGSCKVTHNMLKMWREEFNCSTFYITSQAIENTFHSYITERMDTVLLGLPHSEDIPSAPVGMYVLSNESKYLGAGVIICDAVLNAMCSRLEVDEIVIIPSSIHEVIVLPKDESTDLEYINQTIKEVNDSTLLAEEVLSYHCYTFRTTVNKEC